MKNLKKVFAILLAVLTVVGIFPLSVFASTSAPAYTGKEYDSDILKEVTPSDVYKTESKYWQKITLNNGSGYTNSHLSRSSREYWQQISNKNYQADIFNKNLSGLDVAMSFDITVNEAETLSNLEFAGMTSAVGAITGWMPFKEGTDSAAYTLVTISVDATDTENPKFAFGLPTAGKGYGVAGTQIYELESGAKYNVSILFDANSAASKTASADFDNYYVYIGKYDGDTVNPEYCGKGDFYENEAAYYQNNLKQEEAQTAWKTGDYANMSTGLMFNGFRIYADVYEVSSTEKYGIIDMNVSRNDCYYYDEDGDGDASDTVRQTNVVNDSSDRIIHYNNFDAESTKTAGVVSGSIANAKANYVDNGNGNKALLLNEKTGTSTDYYYQVEYAIGSGVSFVIQGDYKWVKSRDTSYPLIGATCKADSATAYGDMNVVFVVADKNGGLWLSSKADEVTATPATGDAGVPVDVADNQMITYATEKIGQLYADEFTNIAVAVDVPNNVYTVYINGVAVKSDITFLAPLDIAEFAKTTSFKDGFGVTRIRQKSLIGAVEIDNFALYKGTAIINSNTSPLNGIYNDKIYVNGAKKIGEFMEYNGDIYFTDANGIIQKNVTKTNSEGVTYYFGSDGKGIISDGDIIINEDTGAVYNNIQEAIDAAGEGDVITLSTDVAATDITVMNDIIIDLAGNTITADSFVGFGELTFTDSGEEKGLLNIPRDRLSVIDLVTTDSILIYKDDADDAKSGYIVSAVTDQKEFTSDTANGKFELILRPSFTSKTGDDGRAENRELLGTSMLIDGETVVAANVKLLIRLEDENGNKIKEFEFADKLVLEAYQTDMALKITVNGISSYYNTINVKYIIASETGMNCVINAGTYNAD